MFRLIALAILAFILYALIFFKIDYKSTLIALGRVDLTSWLLILGLSFGNYFLRYFRWSRTIAIMSVEVPFKIHFPIYLAGFAMTVTPGKAGEWLRAVFLKPFGVGYGVSTWVFLYEHVLDLFVITIFASLILVNFPTYIPWVAILVLGMFLAVVFLRTKHIRQLIIDFVEGAGWKRALAALQKIDLQLLKAEPIFSMKSLAFGAGLGVTAWGLEVIGLTLVLGIMDFSQPLINVAGIYGAAMLFGALSFVPGGVGTAEAVMIIGLTALGCDMSTAVAATLICRASTLWFAVVTGAVSLVVLSVMGYRTKKI
ncbi:MULTISPECIES: lysylphosphatidylglycerol synthase transmembrane domain-containing protein [unclassified Acidovorax]|uniref:lysylphosphatidylglycerol synthase transmembrane domain-containing protein n=1 Tax=unclassified Acidovorax TaxID=2684926 RepID=UPI0028830657|nr:MULTISPECIES: lysylphosphatidylglycerol synthase transmembrane domain-containing protein [unclassified Acidovorax]